jgi:hypothetical protein
MTEPELDTAIDRAVRDLMNVDADSAFRARVSARLQKPARRMLSLRLMTAVATAVALIVAMAWLRRAPGPTAPAPTAARVERPAPVAAPGPEARQVRQPVPSTTDGPRVRHTAVPAIAAPAPPGMLSAAVAESPTSALAPLTAIDPIDVEPLADTSIAPAAIVVAPLEPIAEVQISPLDPRPARN